MISFSKSAETELISIVGSVDPAVDVIFVHGLDGDPYDTWRMSEPDSWAAWIIKKIPRACVWSLRYRLHTLGLQGGAMPLTTRAINVLDTLDADLKEERPIVFVCHSYGGLLVKQILRSAADIATRYRPVTDRVAGIVFFGTPNGGSSVASFVGALQPVLRTSTAIDELTRSSALLQDLNFWFRNAVENNDWVLRVYCEGLPTLGTIVVDRVSADLGIASVVPVEVDADHIQICKPSASSSRAKQTLSVIEQVIVKHPRTEQVSWMAKIIRTPNDQLYQLEAELEAELAQHPSNVEARKALAHLRHLHVATQWGRNQRETQSRVSPPIGRLAYVIPVLCAVVAAFIFFEYPQDNKQSSKNLSDIVTRSGGAIGAVNVVLSWNTTDDLDLVVICPNGAEISFMQKENCGGRLDVDVNVDPRNKTSTPVENITWAHGDAPRGTYKVEVIRQSLARGTVQRHDGASDVAPVDFVMSLLINGVVKESVNGSFAAPGRKPLFSFTLPYVAR